MRFEVRVGTGHVPFFLNSTNKRWHFSSLWARDASSVRRACSMSDFVATNLCHSSERNEQGDEFSEDSATRFLKGYRVGDEERERTGQGWRMHTVWGVSVLANFAETGRIERAFADVEAIHLVPAMQNTLRDYVQYCKDRL